MDRARWFHVAHSFRECVWTRRRRIEMTASRADGGGPRCWPGPRARGSTEKERRAERAQEGEELALMDLRKRRSWADPPEDWNTMAQGLPAGEGDRSMAGGQARIRGKYAEALVERVHLLCQAETEPRLQRSGRRRARRACAARSSRPREEGGREPNQGKGQRSGLEEHGGLAKGSLVGAPRRRQGQEGRGHNPRRS